MNLKKLYTATHPFHIFVAIWNLLCLFGLTITTIYLPLDSEYRGDLTSLFLFVGLYANLFAVSIALFVLLYYFTVKLLDIEKEKFISRNWLGIFNGGFVFLFWFSAVQLTALYEKLVK